MITTSGVHPDTPALSRVGMPPGTVGSVDPVDRARLGFDEACARIGQTGTDIHRAYIAAVEAVMWARTIDEHRDGDPKYTALRSAHPGGGHMIGLRLARNRQLHDLVNGPAEHLEGFRFP